MQISLLFRTLQQRKFAQTLGAIRTEKNRHQIIITFYLT